MPKSKPEPSKKPSALREEVEQLKKRKEELRTELASVQHKLDVYIPALRVMEGEDGEPRPFTPGNWDLFDSSQLTGLPLKEAITIMARYAGGTVNVKDMGPLLVRFGLIEVKHPYQATAKAYTSMYSNHSFKKTGSGIFTLIEG